MPTFRGNRDFGFKSRRGKDVKLQYTTDTSLDYIIAVRTFVDGSGNDIPTKPPLWLTRVVPGAGCATRLKGMRSVEICMPNANNKQGFSIFNLPIPFNDNNLIESLREFDTLPDVGRIRYTGESISHEFNL